MVGTRGPELASDDLHTTMSQQLNRACCACPALSWWFLLCSSACPDIPHPQRQLENEPERNWSSIISATSTSFSCPNKCKGNFQLNVNQHNLFVSSGIQLKGQARKVVRNRHCKNMILVLSSECCSITTKQPLLAACLGVLFIAQAPSELQKMSYFKKIKTTLWQLNFLKDFLFS